MMHICGFLLPVSKQLLSCTCRLGRVVRGAARSITTGGNHVTLGKDKDKKKTIESYEKMEVFLGKWHLQKTTYYKGHKLAPTKNVTLETKQEPGTRFYLHYQRKGDLWSVETGSIDADVSVVYTFHFNDSFVTRFADGTYVETLVRPDGNTMIWAQIRQPSNEPVRITTEVTGNKLVWWNRYLDGTKFLRIYKKE